MDEETKFEEEVNDVIVELPLEVTQEEEEQEKVGVIETEVISDEEIA